MSPAQRDTLPIWAARNGDGGHVELWSAPPHWSHRHQHWKGSLSDWLAAGFCPDGFEEHTGVRLEPGQCFELEITAKVVREVAHDE